MIDLSKNLNKLVQVTLSDGQEHTGIVSISNLNPNWYALKGSQLTFSFPQDGNIVGTEFNITKITTLSEETGDQLKEESIYETVRNLTPEVILYIESLEEYSDMVYNLVDKFLSDKLRIDAKMRSEITRLLSDRICLKPRSTFGDLTQ